MKQFGASVGDWMTPGPVTVTPDTSLISAYEVMDARHIRRFPVVDCRGNLVGIVTQSDIQRVVPCAATSDRREKTVFELAGMTVEEIMARTPITVEAELEIGEAAIQMIRHKVSGLPVVDAGRIVGIITESDIFRAFVEAIATQQEQTA